MRRLLLAPLLLVAGLSGAAAQPDAFRAWTEGLWPLARERESVAGFLHIGTLKEPALERPRPDLAAKVTRLP